LSFDGSHPAFGPVPATVLDPFVGSGTTMIAARRIGRASIGVELSERYALEETSRRLAEWWKDPARTREKVLEGQMSF
jgi:DNA modification methylase